LKLRRQAGDPVQQMYKRYDDGTVIRARTTLFGMDIVDIYSPPVGVKEGESIPQQKEILVVALPDIYIEMYNVALWQPQNQEPRSGTPAEFYRTINTEDYDGNPTYWWEVCGSCDVDYTLSLVDTSNAEYASITLPSGGDPYIVSRQAVQFYPPEGETVFAVTFPFYGSTNLTVGAIRIIIKQDDTATRTMVQIPLQCLGEWGSDYDYYYGLPLQYSTYPEGYNGNRSTHTCTTYDASLLEWDHYAYSSIWKYDETELATISKIVFEAVGGAPPQYHAGTGASTIWHWLGSDDPTASWGIALFDASETIVPNTLVTGSYSQLVTYSVELAITSGVYHEKVYWTLDEDGLPIWELFSPSVSWTIYPPPWNGKLKWWVQNNPWYRDPKYSGYNGLLSQLYWQWKDADQLDSMYIALFDATDSLMVAGTELVWEANSSVSRKNVEIDPSLLVSGHEYEIRFKIPDSGGTGCELGFEANLYVWLNPATSVTVWQRVAKGEYMEYMGRSAAPYVGDESRVMLNVPVGNSAYFENVAFSWGSCGPPCYYSLYDAGIEDSGLTGSDVEDSKLYYDDVLDVEVRHRKRSDKLTLTNGNRYITDEPNAESELFQIQAFIVVSNKVEV
jgi:hypothetical protein